MNYFRPKVMGKTLLFPLSLALGVCLTGCFDERSAGTSSTTGNPVKVAMGFSQDGEPIRVTGRVRFFSPTHVPMFDSGALAMQDLKGQDSLVLLADSMEAIVARSTDSKLVGPDSILVLNAFVISSDGKGCALPGIRFHTGRNVFDKPDAWVPAEGALAWRLLLDYSGKVEVRTSERIAYFLFLPGSPFHARLEGNQFTLKGVPQGRHTPRLLPVPTSRTTGTAPIEGMIHSLGDSLEPNGSSPIPLGAVLDTVRVPDAWWNSTFNR